jgi:Flp pilus assembly pilin Flp
MPGRVRAALAALLRSAHADPIRALGWLVAAIATVYVVVYPFAVVHFPPMTDLPFHAAQMSVFRHYDDPAWHFQEQFTLHPLQVPYISAYLIGAALSFIMPVTWAAKGMAISMLLLLPAGLAVLFHGMRKSPLWGLVGLGFVWSNMSHFGFLNFVGATGLYAACVGCTLLALDRPSRRHQIALGVALAALFFTHVYRFPFALLAIVATTAVMYPATRRVRPVAIPWLSATALFGVWMLARPPALRAGLGHLSFHTERFHELPGYLFKNYRGATGTEERHIAFGMLAVFIALLLISAILAVRRWRATEHDASDRRWAVGVTVLPLLLAAGHLFAYFVLPMGMGVWWYIFPREALGTAFILVAVVPDLPSQQWLRLGAVTAIAFATGDMGYLVARQWHDFDQLTWDFRAIMAEVPPAPKLFYLVYDHSGTDRIRSPFTHLPAWVQAEKGGWLGFHFAMWGTYPVRYRKGGVVPPRVPDDWEFTPQYFQVKKQGVWFDTFLVRHHIDPHQLFDPDPSIHLVAQRGTWWLYRRKRQHGR